MARLEVDPQFGDYVVAKPKLTYVQQNHSPLRKFIVNRLELIMGRDRLESIYLNLKDKPFDIVSFFGDAIEASGMNINHRGIAPDEIAVDGPLMFLANHPFGIVDGMVLCDLAARVRGDFRILINSALYQDEDLAPYFLPVDFEDSKRAMKTNIRSKQLAIEALSNNIPVLIFPSGMVSTAGKLGFGKVTDAPWTTFAAKLVKQSKATVVPVYFHGRNSRKFHVASNIAETLRMGFLMHEALNKFGGEVTLAIGEPIPWSKLRHHSSRQTLTDALYRIVQNLKSR